jgi:hypothetical protein
VSISTGLKFSPRRPFRLVCVPDDPRVRQRLERDYSLVSINPSDPPPQRFEAVHGWARLVRRALRPENLATFAALVEHETGSTAEQLEIAGTRLLPQLESRSTGAKGIAIGPTLRSGDLTALEGLCAQLRHTPSDPSCWHQWEALHEQSLADGHAELTAEIVRSACQILGPPQQQSELIARVSSLLDRQRTASTGALRRTVDRLGELPLFDGREQWLRLAEHVLDEQSAGEAHDSESAPAALAAPTNGPAAWLATLAPNVAPRAERLDAVLRDSLSRSVPAAHTRTLWREVREGLDAELAEQVNHRYLQYLVGLWEIPDSDDPPRDPQRAVRVLEAIGALLDG